MMNNSQLSYNRNIQEFNAKIKNSYVHRVLFKEDNYPTFNKASIPFEFLYCLDVIFITEKGNYRITTSQTEDSLDTFWIDAIEEIDKDLKVYEINSKVIDIFVENSVYNYPFKLVFEFEHNTLILYSAEIYDNAEKHLEYRINDEMIIVFINKEDAFKFEKEINSG